MHVAFCGGKFNWDAVQASCTGIHIPASVPSTAPAWNDTFLERTSSPGELMVPRCRAPFSPSRPIVLAKVSRISDAWLPESSSANVFTLTPAGGVIAMATICSKTVVETQFTDDVPTKTGAAPRINGW